MMKKMIKVTTLALLLSTPIGLSVNATMPTPNPPQAPQTQENPKTEETTQFKKDAKELQERFNNLTEAQKQEIFSLTGEIREKQNQLLEKYVEFGLLTQEEADALREAMEKNPKN